MNGAEALVTTANKAGIEVCFANAGTTEMPVLTALDSAPVIRPVLGLFEGACTGAADGYARMLGKPAMVLLHLGPGFANGIANLHNAKRANMPVLNVIGEHATWHLAADPPLAMDIEALAGSVSGWYRTTTSVSDIPQDVADAVVASMYGQISTLIVPNDYLSAECTAREVAIPQPSFCPVDQKLVEEAARLLKGSTRVALILGGRGLRKTGLQTAARIKAATGCDLLADTFPGYVERGVGVPNVARIPYFPEPALELLSKYQTFVLVGAKEPVTFFGYEGIPSHLISDSQRKLVIAGEDDNSADVLAALADYLNAPPLSSIGDGVLAKPNDFDVPGGDLTPEAACLTVAAIQPEEAIIVDEGLTSALQYYPSTAGSPPHSFITVSGGSIGYGIPCATGAAIACPDRPVINFQADGSAMYTVQALWTQAREGLNVTTLIASNRSYNILKLELERVGITEPGPNTLSLIDLSRPCIDWASIARGMGVPGVAVRTTEHLARELSRALSEPGPHLIEMILA